MSTIHTPLTYNEINGKPVGLDYELAKQFADYLGVKTESDRAAEYQPVI